MDPEIKPSVSIDDVGDDEEVFEVRVPSSSPSHQQPPQASNGTVATPTREETSGGEGRGESSTVIHALDTIGGRRYVIAVPTASLAKLTVKRLKRAIVKQSAADYAAAAAEQKGEDGHSGEGGDEEEEPLVLSPVAGMPSESSPFSPLSPRPDVTTQNTDTFAGEGMGDGSGSGGANQVEGRTKRRVAAHLLLSKHNFAFLLGDKRLDDDAVTVADLLFSPSTNGRKQCGGEVRRASSSTTLLPALVLVIHRLPPSRRARPDQPSFLPRRTHAPHRQQPQEVHADESACPLPEMYSDGSAAVQPQQRQQPPPPLLKEISHREGNASDAGTTASGVPSPPEPPVRVATRPPSVSRSPSATAVTPAPAQRRSPPSLLSEVETTEEAAPGPQPHGDHERQGKPCPQDQRQKPQTTQWASSARGDATSEELEPTECTAMPVMAPQTINSPREETATATVLATTRVTPVNEHREEERTEEREGEALSMPVALEKEVTSATDNAAATPALQRGGDEGLLAQHTRAERDEAGAAGALLLAPPPAATTFTEPAREEALDEGEHHDEGGASAASASASDSDTDSARARGDPLDSHRILRQYQEFRQLEDILAMGAAFLAGEDSEEGEEEEEERRGEVEGVSGPSGAVARSDGRRHSAAGDGKEEKDGSPLPASAATAAASPMNRLTSEERARYQAKLKALEKEVEKLRAQQRRDAAWVATLQDALMASETARSVLVCHHEEKEAQLEGCVRWLCGHGGSGIGEVGHEGGEKAALLSPQEARQLLHQLGALQFNQSLRTQLAESRQRLQREVALRRSFLQAWTDQVNGGGGSNRHRRRGGGCESFRVVLRVRPPLLAVALAQLSATMLKAAAQERERLTSDLSPGSPSEARSQGSYKGSESKKTSAAAVLPAGMASDPSRQRDLPVLLWWSTRANEVTLLPRADGGAGTHLPLWAATPGGKKGVGDVSKEGSGGSVATARGTPRRFAFYKVYCDPLVSVPPLARARDAAGGGESEGSSSSSSSCCAGDGDEEMDETERALLCLFQQFQLSPSPSSSSGGIDNNGAGAGVVHAVPRDSANSQAGFFANEVAPLVLHALEGRDATVVAYGQGGSGKSFTIFGPPPLAKQRRQQQRGKRGGKADSGKANSNPVGEMTLSVASLCEEDVGIAPRALERVFHALTDAAVTEELTLCALASEAERGIAAAALRQLSGSHAPASSSSPFFSVELSLAELHNDHVYDLMAEPQEVPITREFSLRTAPCDDDGKMGSGEGKGTSRETTATSRPASGTAAASPVVGRRRWESPQREIKVRPDGTAEVVGLTQLAVGTAEDAIAALHTGLSRRRTTSLLALEEGKGGGSSAASASHRSHVILTIRISRITVTVVPASTGSAKGKAKRRESTLSSSASVPPSEPAAEELSKRRRGTNRKTKTAGRTGKPSLTRSIGSGDSGSSKEKAGCDSGDCSDADSPAPHHDHPHHRTSDHKHNSNGTGHKEDEPREDKQEGEDASRRGSGEAHAYTHKTAAAAAAAAAREEDEEAAQSTWDMRNRRGPLALQRVTSKLTFVDLAGYERVGESGVSGERLREAQSVNASLSALGDVMAAMAVNGSKCGGKSSSRNDKGKPLSQSAAAPVAAGPSRKRDKKPAAARRLREDTTPQGSNGTATPTDQRPRKREGRHGISGSQQDTPVMDAFVPYRTNKLTCLLYSLLRRSPSPVPTTMVLRPDECRRANAVTNDSASLSTTTTTTGSRVLLVACVAPQDGPMCCYSPATESTATLLENCFGRAREALLRRQQQLQLASVAGAAKTRKRSGEQRIAIAAMAEAVSAGERLLQSWKLSAQALESGPAREEKNKENGARRSSGEGKREGKHDGTAADEDVAVLPLLRQQQGLLLTERSSLSTLQFAARVQLS